MPPATAARWHAITVLAMTISADIRLTQDASGDRCLLAGGHSIDDPEPEYGMAVTGRPGRPLPVTPAGGTR